MMFNPDQPAEKKVSQLPNSPSPRELENEYQVFRGYLMNSSHVRKAYGLGKDMSGVFWVEDVEKARKAEGKYKGFLYQFCDEMKQQDKWVKKT